MTEEEARALYAQGETPTVGKLLEQDALVRQLEARLATDSHNSSKPPSTDGFHKPAPKSLRMKNGRKPGGQKGHHGSTLALSDTPDKIVPHPVILCSCCGRDLSKQVPEKVERRQEHDIPQPRMYVTEQRFETKTCPGCHTVTSSIHEAPKGFDAPVQYGPRITALCAYLKTYQLLPFKRCAELIQELSGGTLCEGTLATMVSKVGDSLDAPLAAIHDVLTGSDVAHFDETGTSVRGKRHWLHVASTKKVTLYTIHPKRGTEAMDAMAVLPNFKGRAIHDHWRPYYTYKDCLHGLCNVHHLRELTFVHEQMHQDWAKLMKDLLVKIKSAVDLAKASGREALGARMIARFKRRYSSIIAKGVAINPAPIPVPGKRGKPKDTKAGNLVRRLKGHRKEVLAFMGDFSVPFGNNLAERDLRMMKVQQKISGTFRADAGGATFCRIRSYLSTAAKHCLSALDVLVMAINGAPFMPDPN
ncbi:MAG: IS66 family transposase [Rectinemataceae bacterium]